MKSERCIFVGYKDGIKGYKLWNPVTRTVTYSEDPISARDARSRADANQWELAMVDEMESLRKNQTWGLCKLPKGRKAIGSKWVFKQKVKADGTVEKYKARLVAKGFSQVEGVDYDEIFSPVAKLTSIRMVLSIAAVHDLEIEQMDVKTAFLHGDLEEEIYMRQPEGFEAKGKEDLVCRLKKSLYGLKQSPRMWYQKFDTYMLEVGFERLNSDHCVYIQRKGEHFTFLTLYVDDMLLVGNSVKMIQHVKKMLSAKFEMKDLGPASVILRMQIIRDRSKRKLWLGQQRYVEEVLKKFNMADCKPVGAPMPVGNKLSAEMCPKTHEEMEDMVKVPYASAVGSLMYAMVCTRPDIAQAVGVLSRYMAKPGKEHWNAVKRVFRYLRGTSNYSICYEGAETGRVLNVVGHVDSDWGGDLDSRKSTSGYVFTLFGGAVSWMSRRQGVVALSSTEAEYMALTHASKEAIWLGRLCGELSFEQGPVKPWCDSQRAIQLAKNPAFHARTKHIDIQFHFIREKVEKQVVQLEKVDTKENSSDFLTKAVPIAKFEWCATAVGLKRKIGGAALICGSFPSSGRMLGLWNTSGSLVSHTGLAHVSLEESKCDPPFRHLQDRPHLQDNFSSSSRTGFDYGRTQLDDRRTQPDVERRTLLDVRRVEHRSAFGRARRSTKLDDRRSIVEPCSTLDDRRTQPDVEHRTLLDARRAEPSSTFGRARRSAELDVRRPPLDDSAELDDLFCRSLFKADSASF
ncbi:hypothetical protein KSP39_PZI023164 [Platanthera zijinensis]|uniref:Reverse transcriptase Ty1/copia-type domain-containing protein n=1 Tax=Platanthera zijinensis TaxID=2320716 RepID=A0AAP0AV35_9ASPA